MTNTIIYIDISGSVSDFLNYWNKVDEIVSLNKDAFFFVWDTEIKEISYNEILKYIENKKGYGGTKISSVASSIINKKFNDKNIIIITDGEVHAGDVKSSEFILKDFNIKEVECHIIKSYVYSDDIDISVPLAFMRNNTSKLYYTNPQNITKLIKNINKDDYKILENITLNDLMANFDMIYDLINITNMGKSGLPYIKQKLLKFRTDFIKLSNENLKSINGNTIQSELKNGNYTNAITMIKKIEDIFINQNEYSPITKFNKLLALCDDRTNSGFALNQKIANAKQSEAIIPDEATEEELIKYNFEDPVMLDLDVPQLVIIKSSNKLFDTDKDFKNFIENPLNIINNEEIKERIAKRFGHCIGIKLTNKCIIDPFTRAEIIGTIPLTTSNEQHNEVGSHALFNLFTNSKKMGNPNLYYIILWQILVVENRCEYLNEYYDYITNHLKFRLSKATTYISLCGLPDFNRTIVPIDVAMYYIINGPEINKIILRKHIFNINVIQNIIMNVFKYEVKPEIIKHINLERTLLSMLSQIKKNPVIFKRKIKCLINSHIIADDEYIPIDNIATEKNINEIMKTFPDYYNSHKYNELVYLSTLVNSNYSAGDIQLDYNKEIKYDIEFKNDWSDKYIISTINPLEISLKTFRIVYNPNWKELAVNDNFVSIDNQISAYNDYIKFFLRFQHFPTFNEFAKYIYNKYKKALHKDFNNIYIEVSTSYNKVREYIKDNNLTYDDIKKIILDSCRIDDRIRIQESI
uniref:VWFA domain-containing protein n=1 Tax=viral metagenome TaxID=1070528 RepID=A0A6C0ETW0_9ZZZZ